jgi:hypothetical protein
LSKVFDLLVFENYTNDRSKIKEGRGMMLFHVIFISFTTAAFRSFITIVVVTNKCSKTLEALLIWRETNPDLSMGDWPEARQLILEHIKIREELFKHVPFLTDDGCIELLLSLLDEKGPNPPTKAALKTGCFFIAKKP